MNTRSIWRRSLPIAFLGLVHTGLSQDTPSSDPKALAIIDAAIVALGGVTAWQEVGGATAEAVITPLNTPVVTVAWSDDWSGGRLRFRRDSRTGSSPSTSLVGSDASQVRQLPNGNSVPMPHDNGIALLAFNYPAPALILSLSRQYACTFRLGRPVNPRVASVEEDSDEVIVSEFCPDPFYPGGEAVLRWVFSKGNRFPKSVELPIWGMTHHLLRTQTVRFLAYQIVNSLSVPALLEIRRISGSLDQVTVSNVRFARSLPDDTFKTPN